MTEKRELGPEINAEGWASIGGDWISFLHVPSLQVVSLDSYRRDSVDSPAYPSEPINSSAEGFFVSCVVHDELGNPTLDGWGLWIESYSLALRIARAARQNVIDGHHKFTPNKQLSFDDLLERKDLKP